MPPTTKKIRIIRRRVKKPQIINWGKYKGQPISSLLSADDDYLSWLLYETEEDFAKKEKKFLEEHGYVKDLDSDEDSDSE